MSEKGKTTEEVKEKDVDKAIKEIQQQREESRKECLEEIQKILDKYNCLLTARMIVGERGNMAQVFLMDKPNEK